MRPITSMCTRVYSGKMRDFDLFETKQESYHKLQVTFEKKRYLVHFNLAYQLYTNIDFSKKNDINRKIYHVKIEFKID